MQKIHMDTYTKIKNRNIYVKVTAFLFSEEGSEAIWLSERSPGWNTHEVETKSSVFFVCPVAGVGRASGVMPPDVFFVPLLPSPLF